MTRFPQRFQPPVIIGQGRDEPREQHEGDDPPCQDRAARQHHIGDIHRRFHPDHGNQRHANGGFKRQPHAHLPRQDDCFQHDGGHQPVENRQRHDRPHRPWRAGQLEIRDCPHIAHGATD